MAQELSEKVVILGTGPAGLTASIYAARANLNPLCIEGMEPGGQLTLTTDVENYPGFPEGITGPEMMTKFRRQAQRFGARFLAGEVVEVNFESKPYTLKLSNGDQILCESLIISTGASAKWLGIESEKKLMGKGVSACATCDGFFFKGMDVAVIGGGDTAMEEAAFLTKFAKSVSIIHRRDQLRASKIMQDKAKKNPKIQFVWNAMVSEILGEDEVTGVRLKDTQTGAKRVLPVQGVFLGIGHRPNSKLFEGKLEMDETGYLLVKPGSTKTGIPGVFAAGDIADHVYRQAITASGTGCMAAIDAERYLDSQEG